MEYGSDLDSNSIVFLILPSPQFPATPLQDCWVRGAWSQTHKAAYFQVHPYFSWRPVFIHYGKEHLHTSELSGYIPPTSSRLTARVCSEEWNRWTDASERSCSTLPGREGTTSEFRGAGLPEEAQTEIRSSSLPMLLMVASLEYCIKSYPIHQSTISY